MKQLIGICLSVKVIVFAAGCGNLETDVSITF